jgi:hypothetical protein
MARRRAIIALGLWLVLSATGLLVASNMGLMHRASFPLGGVDYWLSLPYSTEMQKAQDLCEAIGPEADLIAYFDSESNTRVEWHCPFGSNFDLRPGRGIQVRVSAPAGVVLLGSHDQSVMVPEGGFTHPGRDYYLALPYHTTAAVAADLCEEIPHVSVISRFDADLNTTQTWTCPFGTNFALRTGEALLVQVSAPSAGFIPDHY